MGKYTTKITDEEGKDAWISSDGKQFGTRSGAWKHSKSLDVEPEVDEPSEPTLSNDVSDNQPDPISWASVDFGGELEEVTEVVPNVLKKITPTVQGGKKTRKELEQERKTNIAILKIGYRTGDHLLTNYKRAMLEDPKADAITHSEDDYTWISGVSNAALEENGLSIGSVVGTTQIAVIANGYWFGSPIAKIHKEAEKSPFKGRIGGSVGRFLERLPFIGKRLKARKQIKIDILEGEKNE
tara:strand:- start:7941 stop:8660 length:720 start_codon:yes stop_codon:yes gene_type:complete